MARAHEKKFLIMVRALEKTSARVSHMLTEHSVIPGDHSVRDSTSVTGDYATESHTPQKVLSLGRVTTHPASLHVPLCSSTLTPCLCNATTVAVSTGGFRGDTTLVNVATSGGGTCTAPCGAAGS